MKPLVKGELDWHEKINENFGELSQGMQNANQTAGQAAIAAASAESAVAGVQQATEQLGKDKLDRAESTEEMPEGYVFQKTDGSTELRPAEAPEGEKFKYTIVVDNGSDGNPAAVEYVDDCFGFIEANGSDLGDWGNTTLYKDYFKPCVIQPGDGAPAYYLQKDNRTLKEDGSSAVLTGADGDVMIQVKKLYGKFLKSGNRLKISISNVKEDDTWFCFTDFGNGEEEHAYRGAYKAGVLAGATTVMRSVSGVAPLVNITRATGRTYAGNRGAGYHQNNFFLLMLWQVMYLMMYKNKNSQVCLGQGRSLSSNTAASNTGWGNTKPFCWGDQGGVNGVVFLGVEDFYSNVWEWVDGVTLVSQVFKITRNPDKYNDTGVDAEISQPSGCTASANNDKYITKVQGTNDAGFLPAGSGGSSSTYFCDNMWTADGTRVVVFGGDWSYAAKVGAFCWGLRDTASNAYANVGSRLCRKNSRRQNR